MIGRDEEQSALHAFLAAVPGGPAALVLRTAVGRPARRRLGQLHA